MELLTRIYRINCKYPAQLFNDVKYSLSLIQLNSFRIVSFWFGELKAAGVGPVKWILEVVENPYGGSQVSGFRYS